MSKAQEQKQRSAHRARAWARTVTLAVVACLALLILPAAAAASDPFGDLTASSTGPLGSPTISSDKAEYAPGESVILTGDQWLPGEHVHITVNDSVGQTWIRESDVSADSSGAIRDEFQLPNTFIAEYAVTATGDASGTATTSFADGNVKVSAAPTAGPNAATFTVTETVYDQANNCTGNVNANKSGTAAASFAAQATVGGVNEGQSVRLDASEQASAPANYVFNSWASIDGHPFTVIGGTGGRSICVAGFQGGGSKEFRATYEAATSAPSIASDNASRTVSEGTEATNTGTWSDSNPGDTVTLSASVGTVTKSGTNADGTWSWSYTPQDGPANSQNVTITANDGTVSRTTTFALTVNNAAPIVTAAAAQTADEGTSASFNLGSFDDPGAQDGPWAVDVDWGDGSAHTTFNAASRGTLDAKSHTYADDKAGGYTVTVMVTDKDGASDTKTFTLTVANKAPTVTLTGPETADEGDTKSYSYIWTDPGTDDTFPAAGNSVSCGPKGTASEKLFDAASKTGSFKCQFSDDSGLGTFEVKATVTDDDGGAGSGSVQVKVANVAPTASNGTFVVDPLFGTATAGFDFSDVGFGDTHSSSYFSWSDVGNRVATVTETSGTGHASDVRTLDPGCYELTVTGTAKDDEGATSTPPLVVHSGAQTSVYGKGFRPPIVDNERNIAKYGNVVPVKVVLTNTCTGATVTNTPLFVTTHLGTGGEVIEGTEVVTESVSSADSGSQMRTADGMYMYNLSTRSMTAGKDYTIRIRPNSTTAPWILQAVVQPKK